MAKLDNSSKISSVLFDLDGTLLDTAPDMTNALNLLLAEEDKAPLTTAFCRDFVSHGSVAMVTLGFGEQQNPDEFERRRLRFLHLYERNLCLDTKLFEGMDEVLLFLEENYIRWGIVTNKPAFLTNPLLEQLKLSQRACSVISGDTIPERKPDPAPLYLAASQCGSLATECIYVGDAERDIQAGNRANMQTLIASYGYIDDSQTPVNWGANGVIEYPDEILPWLN
ncbi:HAD-IA family hydrolase [Cocleimonas sp. KMM 6892]|uniref:HAD-IA family hydrolase n=1 Tax=unclassified Cocleimonas TaxID=2639732 RepID=UPI002DBF1F73|nr:MULTISPECIES: HAD-IA family hydrolase [unclassified Cocleimonas]MEB8434122.1 HAD-IA family hydrolase [Cocleimonas sp. KMM 6892]MEC4717018.1 HAD-IA family hydrolase [Cocleimonas sp. KMM 6895]MEC4746394.1 HAD-IA family hydrolase [Cocleimonas sp. KMM 6896]